MDARTIDILSAYDPSSKLPKISTGQLFAAKSALHTAAAERFISGYSRVNFGWYIANQYRRAGIQFPVPLFKRDYWVVRAYLMLIDDRYYDRHVAEAFHINNRTAGISSVGATLKGFLLTTTEVSPQRHLQAVANISKIDVRTIEAYETLFYNVLDRMEDAMYIAHEVYPDTRMVEFNEDYVKNTSLSDLLKRAGYNHRDLELSAYLAGIGDKSYLAKLAGMPDRESELSKYIMGNGLMLTRTGLLNQRSVGLARSSTLLAASRQSGTPTEAPIMDTISGGFNDALREAMALNEHQTTDMMREDEGLMPTIDV